MTIDTCGKERVRLPSLSPPRRPHPADHAAPRPWFVGTPPLEAHATTSTPPSSFFLPPLRQPSTHASLAPTKQNKHKQQRGRSSPAMRSGPCPLPPAVAARSLLSPFGIGVSKRLALVGSGNSITALLVKENVPAGTPLLLAPDAALLTCQGALDADVDGLVPPPAEMLELLKRDTAQLDHVYLAYYLSLRCFTNTEDWFSGQIHRFKDGGSTSQEDAASSRIWERFAQKYVTAPAPVFMAALQYVWESCFRKPATEADSASAPLPAALAVAPVVDVASQSRNATNSALTATTAKALKETYLHGDITGARQALLAKNDAYVYWVLTAITDIPVGSEVSVSSESVL